MLPYMDLPVYNSENVQFSVNFFMTSQWLPHALIGLL